MKRMPPTRNSFENKGRIDYNSIWKPYTVLINIDPKIPNNSIEFNNSIEYNSR